MPTKRATGLLLTIGGLLCLAHAAPRQEAPNKPMQHEQQHPTISGGPMPRAQPQELANETSHETTTTVSTRLPRQAQQLVSGAKTAAVTEGSRVSDQGGLDALMDDKYLELRTTTNNQPEPENQIDVSSASRAEQQKEAVADKRNLFGALRTAATKPRRPTEQQIKSSDWWTKLINENRAKKAQAAGPGKQVPDKPKGVVYREQPLNQNALLTIRYQLVAIRDKHRMLMLKSVPQLMQLDQKLIDTYRLCLKRDMPLYAGMLYRTRDYVVRMANEIKQERQVLEAMARQIQKVLRHKSTNSTLVKEYNRQLALASLPIRSAASLAQISSLASTEAGQVAQQQPQQQYRLSASQEDSNTDNKSIEGSNEFTGRTPLVAGLASSFSSNELTTNRDSATTAQKVAAYRAGPREAFSEPTIAEELAPIVQRQNIINNTEQTANPDDKQRSKSKKFSRKPAGAKSVDNRFNSYDEQQSAEDGESSTPTAGALRKQKRVYTVNVNEVNLKKELTKAQALIDRINSSSHELSAVVDDIVYLFKLSPNDVNHRKGLAHSGRTNKFDKTHGAYGTNGFMDFGGADQKMARKMMLKSPLKLFFERYGKMPSSSSALNPTTPSRLDSQTRYTTMGNIATSTPLTGIDANNAPEIKPLFDPSTIAVYKDPIDIDLGFDSPATLDSDM